MMQSRPCDTCGAEYKPTRRHSRFCSGPCRQKSYRDRQRVAMNDYDYADCGEPGHEHLVGVPYVSTEISDAHEKWVKGRGTDGQTIRHPSRPK